jgi:hypothetical protein
VAGGFIGLKALSVKTSPATPQVGRKPGQKQDAEEEKKRF